MRTLDKQSLVIVDELQQVCLVERAEHQLAILEFFKEIFDETGCSLVLCGTSESRQMIESGPLAEWLRQIRRRCIPPVVLPPEPSVADLATFAAHFGLTEAPLGRPAELMAKVIAEDGLGLFITYLQATKRVALSLDQPVVWAHFVEAHHQFELLGREKKGKAANGEEGR